jgi:hypothetical protein
MQHALRGTVARSFAGMFSISGGRCYLIQDLIREAPGVPPNMVVDMTDAALCQGLRILGVDEKVEVVLEGKGGTVYPDVGVGKACLGKRFGWLWPACAVLSLRNAR